MDQKVTDAAMALQALGFTPERIADILNERSKPEFKPASMRPPTRTVFDKVREALEEKTP